MAGQFIEPAVGVTDTVTLPPVAEACAAPVGLPGQKYLVDWPVATAVDGPPRFPVNTMVPEKTGVWAKAAD